MTTRAASFIFATASLGPAAALAAGAVAGGIWPYLGLLSMTVLMLILDKSSLGRSASPGQGHWLPLAIGGTHFALLGAGLWAMGSGMHLGTGQKIALMLGLGLFFGQVSNACAHELIHRNSRHLRALGTAIYVSLLNGQHVSAHMLVHHVHAGTARDPNSAPMGQGFWRFFLRASRDEFTAGWRAETRRRQGRKAWRHPYVIYIGGGLATGAGAALIGGGWGVMALLILAVHAQIQLMLSDYLQHYGLRRRVDASGQAEPMGPQHSWNAPQGFSAAQMLNAPLHSDHHMNPARPFPELRYDARLMPTLPRSVPVMGALALVPAVWRRVMDPRVRALRAGQHHDHGNVMPPAPPQPSTQSTVLSE